tara:strand:- start:184 stop:459 length:276 start_codon:yes stop_codon:yes gene_type:complete
MNENKYLWKNISPKKNGTIYIYLNEKNNTIHGDIISNSNNEGEVTDAIYCGIAKKFVTSFKALDLSCIPIGLTDINKKEYQVMKKSWEIKS